jgi:pimeloyl-ACP methyl ester carboxylesterase
MMRRLAFQDPIFDRELLRTMGHVTYGGAEIGECLATAAQIRQGDRESWYAAWTALGERNLLAAQASRADGRSASATSAFLRASNYFRTAYLFHLEAPLPPKVTLAHRRHREAFRHAAAGLRGAPQPVAIPFEGRTLPGYFCSGGDGCRPLVVSVGGYETTAEEAYLWNAAAAVGRGYHAVVFDGPGQGEPLVERGLQSRPDWHLAVSAVIDAFIGRPGVDPDRIAVIGEDWGGYLAGGAAARDPRIAACVLDPPILGLYKLIRDMLPIRASLKTRLPDGPAWLVAWLRRKLAQRARQPTHGAAWRLMMLAHGAPSPWDYILDSRRYDEEEMVGRIACPTLVCEPAGDPYAFQTRRFYDLLSCDKTYARFEMEEGSGAHCVTGNRALFHERVFDWLDSRLRGHTRFAAA